MQLVSEVRGKYVEPRRLMLERDEGKTENMRTAGPDGTLDAHGISSEQPRTRVEHPKRETSLRAARRPRCVASLLTPLPSS